MITYAPVPPCPWPHYVAWHMGLWPREGDDRRGPDQAYNYHGNQDARPPAQGTTTAGLAGWPDYDAHRCSCAWLSTSCCHLWFPRSD